MPKPLPPHPNVRNCTHIKVTGQRCGSPALRGEFFCYFHTRVIKGVAQRVDMRLDPMALLEDCESIQLSTMHVVDGLVKGTLDTARARLILEALRMAARNAKNVRFDDVHYRNHEQPMVRQIPNYAQQYLIEHPEFGPPLSQSPCGVDILVREPNASAIQREAQPALPAMQQTGSEENPAAKRRQITTHGASHGTNTKNDPAPKERKKPSLTAGGSTGTKEPSREAAAHESPAPQCREAEAKSQKSRRDATPNREERELARVQAAIPGAMAGNWRDLRTVFQFTGIDERKKEASS